MVALSGESVWYTDEASDTFGVLNPAAVNGISVTVLPSTIPVTPACSVIGVGINSSVPISTGMAVWSPGVITATVNSGGWQVYQLPSGADPWDIVAVGGNVWVADRDRDKLVWFSHRIYLPLVLKGQ
jgi:streptogramin lyase